MQQVLRAKLLGQQVVQAEGGGVAAKHERGVLLEPQLGPVRVSWGQLVCKLVLGCQLGRTHAPGTTVRASLCFTARNMTFVALEDEEHEIFDYPEYNTCRLNYPEVFSLTGNNINIFLILTIKNLPYISFPLGYQKYPYLLR